MEGVHDITARYDRYRDAPCFKPMPMFNNPHCLMKCVVLFNVEVVDFGFVDFPFLVVLAPSLRFRRNGRREINLRA